MKMIGMFFISGAKRQTEQINKQLITIWLLMYDTKTVLTLYEYIGNTIFRVSVDSSPNYDAIMESFYSMNYT